MSSQTFSTFSEVGMIDARLRSGTITLPLTTTIPYRILTLKDIYGATGLSTTTIQTTAPDVFEDGTSTRLLNTAYQSLTVYAGQPGKWMLTATSLSNATTIGTLNISTLNVSSSVNFISGSQFTSTVQGLGSAGYISSPQLLSTSAGLLNPGQLVSTIQGLGSAGYASTSYVGAGLSTMSTNLARNQFINQLAASTFIVSSVIGNNAYFSTLTVDNLNIGQAAGYIALGDIIVNSASTINQYAGTTYNTISYTSTINASSINVYQVNAQNMIGLLSTVNLTSTVAGLGQAGYVSSTQLLSTSLGLTNYINTFIDPPELTSTVTGLGSAGYVSSQQLLSTSLGLANYINTFIDPPELASTVTGLGSAGYVSTTQLLSTSLGLRNFMEAFIDPTELTSTVTGLGSAGYVSTTQLLSTSLGLTNYINTFIDPPELASTVTGLGSAGYVSTTQLLSTSLGLRNYIDAFIDPNELTSTVIGLGTGGFVSTLGLTYSLASTVTGLGTLGYVSTSQLLSTTVGTYQAITAATNVITGTNLTSTVAGLGTAGYISSPQLLSTSLGIVNYISTFSVDHPELASTVTGLGTLGYISSPQLLSTSAGLVNPRQLVSTVQGLGTAGYISSPQLLSTSLGIVNYISTFSVDHPELASTVTGLGTLGYVSSPQLLSTSAGLVNPRQLVSTVQGLGTAGYASTTFVGAALSTFSTSLSRGFFTSTFATSSINANTGFISSLTVNTLFIGSNTGFTNLGDAITTSISSLVIYTGQQYATNTFTSSLNTSSLLSYSNATALFSSQQIVTSSLGVGIARPFRRLEVLSSMRIHDGALQTPTLEFTRNATQGQAFGASASADWVFAVSTGAFPNMNMYASYTGTRTNNLTLGHTGNVGINCNAPQYQLDVNGTIRTAGLAFAASMSTQSIVVSSINGVDFTRVFTSTVQGLGQAGYVSTTQLLSTSAGLVNPLQLTSTVAGLGSAGYVSSTQLLSTSVGLLTYINSFIDPTELTSTVIGLGTGGFVSTLGLTYSLASTVTGLGTLGYISTSQLLSTTVGTYNAITAATNVITGTNLTSTVRGLGTAGYVSTTQLFSTSAGLAAAGLTQTQVTSSINNLLVPYSTLNTATYFNIDASTNQLFFGTFGPQSQIYIGDVKAAYGDSVSTEPTVLINQPIISPYAVGSSNYSYTGSNQTFVAPAGVTYATITMSGAGGGVGASSAPGGAGGYISGILPLTPGSTYTIVVGQGGAYNGGARYGGGGSSGSGSGGAGGGRSAIQFGGLDIVTAGGGGGAAANAGTNGGIGGGLTGGQGVSSGGNGGSQTAGGTGGTSGGVGTGGNASGGQSGGGGGGYYGGGSGSSSGTGSGGGGGSSYVANLTGTVVNTQGGGGTSGNPGGNGSVTITWSFNLAYRNANALEIRGFQGNKMIVDPYMNMGIGISSINSTITLDVAGTMRAPIISTSAFNVSSINNSLVLNGAMLTSTIMGLGTAGYISSSQLTNSINKLLVPYSTLNTATYFNLAVSTNQLFFGTSNTSTSAQVYIGDINSKYGNNTSVTPTFVIEQFPVVTQPVTTSLSATGADQYYTVPAGVNFINVVLNGAGGGGYSGGDGGYRGSASGANGGYVSGRLPVVPGETLKIIVGVGGSAPSTYFSQVNSYGGGGAPGANNGVGNSGGGGGRSAIQRGSADIVTAGGGGGVNAHAYDNGGAGGGLTGAAGAGFNSTGGGGGTQSAGGAGGLNDGSGGSAQAGTTGVGGTGYLYSSAGAGGGGGGYYGGGAGANYGSTGSSGGGGGGSSYVANLTGTVVNTQGGGASGSATTVGGNGSVTITTVPNTQPSGNIIQLNNYLTNKLIVDPLLNVGINVSSINTSFALDVNGPFRSAVFYSTITAGGTMTITPGGNFGVYYNITASGTYTISLASTQPSQNIGKYYVFRNNSGSSLSITITGGSGITSPITVATATTATIMVATTSTYALF